MPASKRVERFSATDLLCLQCDLQQIGIDSWQATELVAAFLNGKGYGVDTELVQDSIVRLERSHCDMDLIQLELERVALVM
jgi:hypothetical protein